MRGHVPARRRAVRACVAPRAAPQHQRHDPAARAQRGLRELDAASRREGRGHVSSDSHRGALLHALAAHDEGGVEAREAEEGVRQPRGRAARRDAAADTDGAPHGENQDAGEV